MNTVIFILFLLECIAVVYWEHRIWKTLYTPINILLLPYAAIVLLAVSLPESMHFVPFYYPSLLVWMGGILLMEIPSTVLAYIYGIPNTSDEAYQFPGEAYRFPKWLWIAGGLSILLATWHLKAVLGSSIYSFGTDEFADEYAIYGLYGHIIVFLGAMTVLLFASVRRHNILLPIVCIIAIAALTMTNQVKSWVIIPLVAGFILCLLMRRIHLNWRVVLLIALSGSTIYAGSYLLNFIVGGSSHYSKQMGTFIVEHFLHYLFSGALGLSEEMRLGLTVPTDPRVFFAPFINVVNTLTGDDVVSPISTVSVIINSDTQIYNNVRTHFGSIYLRGGMAFYMIYPVVSGLFFYVVRIASLKTKSIYIAAIDAWLCAIMAMGWFDFYFWLMNTIEVPILLFLIYLVDCYAKNHHTQLQRDE